MHDHKIASASKVRPDNKVRLSQDVLEKADRIAAEWGLKNARAAVEAVFRRYCDDYLYGRPFEVSDGRIVQNAASPSPSPSPSEAEPAYPRRSGLPTPQCDALDALDQLLAL